MSPQTPQRSLVFPILMVVAGLVLIVGAIWLTMNAQSAQNAVLVEPGNTSGSAANAPSTTPRIPFPAIPRIGVGDAKAALDQQQAIFIDTRGEPFFSEGHIPGALSITETELAGKMSGLDKAAWIIPYCT